MIKYGWIIVMLDELVFRHFGYNLTDYAIRLVVKKERENSNKGMFTKEEVFDIFSAVYKRKYGAEIPLPVVYFLNRHQPKNWSTREQILKYFRATMFLENDFDTEIAKEIDTRLYNKKIQKVLNG